MFILSLLVVQKILNYDQWINDIAVIKQFTMKSPAHQHADIVRGKMFTQLSIFWFLYGYKTLTTTIFNDAIQFQYCFIVM